MLLRISTGFLSFMTNIQFQPGAIDGTGCISNAWNMIKANYWLYFGIALLAAFAVSCIPCVNFLLVGPMMGGVYFVALRAMRGEPVEFSMMFKGFEKFVPLMAVGVLQSVPAIIWQILDFTFRISDVAIRATRGTRDGDFFQSSDTDIMIAGGFLAVIIVVSIAFFFLSIAWAITFAFAVPLVMEHNLSPLDAIKLSARAGWKNVGGLIVLAILLGLIFLAGFFALCIGALFVLPIIYVSWAFAYRQVFPDLNRTPYQNPLPNQYGSFAEGM